MSDSDGRRPIGQPTTGQRYVVLCEDGQCRHGEPFDDLVLARMWEWWGHCCTSRHEIRPVLDDTEPDHIHQARYLGADAALAAVSWTCPMTEADARSILDDVDPEVLDRYPAPDLSGQWADDPTPLSIAREVGANDGDVAFWGIDLLDEVADAWESGRDLVWFDALQAIALRTLGRYAEAVEVDEACEKVADELRKLARS